MTIAVYCDIKQETKQKQQPKTGGGGGGGGREGRLERTSRTPSGYATEQPMDTKWREEEHR